jgi:hypothetical protein
MQLAEETPIACTLDPTTMADRLCRIKALTDTSLITQDLRGDQLRLVYRLSAADEVRAVVELERSCCGFLDFDVREIGRSVVLTISAPVRAQDAAAWLFAQFLPSGGEQAPKQSCGCGSERVCG